MDLRHIVYDSGSKSGNSWANSNKKSKTLIKRLFTPALEPLLCSKRSLCRETREKPLHAATKASCGPNIKAQGEKRRGRRRSREAPGRNPHLENGLQFRTERLTLYI